jgi:hypothetical protein
VNCRCGRYVFLWSCNHSVITSAGRASYRLRQANAMALSRERAHDAHSTRPGMSVVGCSGLSASTAVEGDRRDLFRLDIKLRPKKPRSNRRTRSPQCAANPGAGNGGRSSSPSCR